MQKSLKPGRLAKLKKDYGCLGTVEMAAGVPFLIIAAVDRCVAFQHPKTGGLVWFTKREVEAVAA